MLTSNDIDNLHRKIESNYLSQKTDMTLLKMDFSELRGQNLVMKEDIANMKTLLIDIKNTVAAIFTGMDKFMGRFDTLSTEQAALKASDDRQNKQIKQIAEKVDIKLEE